MTDDVITDAAGDELEHGAPDFPGQFPLGRDWMVKTMTDNARLATLSPLEALVAEMRAAWEAYDRDGSRRIDEAIEALERYAKEPDYTRLDAPLPGEDSFS